MPKTTKKHMCSLGLGSESMLPVVPGESKLCHTLKKMTLIAATHPLSLHHFLSYPAILAERQKQLLEGGKYVIHPYSLFSLIWNSIMIIINMSHMIMSPLRICYILEKTPQPMIHTLDTIMLVNHAICFLDIIVKFNVGYAEGVPSNIVMKRKRIALRYLGFWFYVDIISCMPLAYILISLESKRMNILFGHLLAIFRFFKLFAILRNLRNFLSIFTTSYIWHRTVHHLILFFVTMHWCSCLIYFPAVISYYRNGKTGSGYCIFLLSSNNRELNTFTTWERYQKGTFIACSSFFVKENIVKKPICWLACFNLEACILPTVYYVGTGYSMVKAKHPEEIVVNSLIIIYTYMLLVYILVHIMKIYMTKFNSSMRYQELMNQVEKYMRHKQFPTQLKKRVRAFYNYRYQERYFKEEVALDCLSDQLLNEINLHTCHKLVNKVALFEGLPASVIGTILGCLRPEVFMPNDLMIRAGDIGDCMYFIANGTVAVYSSKGTEVCHLEDGAHFGEVALLMKDSKRVATVIAVEITQVYRLNATDFQEFIVKYQELYERVEVLASKRMHETVLIDEAFKSPDYRRN